MRQLETALALLADRAEPMPTDVLVERLTVQLAAEGMVMDSARGSNLIGSEDNPGLDGPDSMVRRRFGWRPLVVFGAAAAIVLIAVASVLFLGQDRGDVVIQPAPTTTIPGLLATPWERFRDESPEWEIPDVVSDQEVFIAAYNTTFEAHKSCEQAYRAAKNAYEGFHRILEEWDDEVNEQPGLEYDRFGGELRASNDWLIEHECPGRGDFISVG